MIGVPMTVGEWMHVDATMDNEAAEATVDFWASDEGRSATPGDPELPPEKPRAIRQAGWDQHPGWGPPVEVGWPDQTLEVVPLLTAEQWAYTADVLDRWAEMSDEPDDPGPELAARIRAHLP